MSLLRSAVRSRLSGKPVLPGAFHPLLGSLPAPTLPVVTLQLSGSLLVPPAPWDLLQTLHLLPPTLGNPWPWVAVLHTYVLFPLGGGLMCVVILVLGSGLADQIRVAQTQSSLALMSWALNSNWTFPAPPLSTCVTLHTTLSLPGPQFPHL